MLTATLKSIFNQLDRAISTALAVVLGVSFLAGTLIFTDSIDKAFDDLFVTIFETTDVQVRSTQKIQGGFGYEVRGRIDENTAFAVASVDGVAGLYGYVEGPVTIIGSDGSPLGSSGQSGLATFGGAWGYDDELNQFDLVSGRAPIGPGEVVIDDGTAAAGGFQVNQGVRILTPAGSEIFMIVGIAKFGSSSSSSGISFALWELKEAQRVLQAPGQLDSIAVRTVNGVSPSELVERLRIVLPSDIEPVEGSQATEESQSTIRESLAFVRYFLFALAAVAVFVSVFVIFNTFSIVVTQRTREFGLLRAIGATSGQLLRSLFVEAFLIGLVGSLLGLGLGVGLAYGLQELAGLFGFDLPTSDTVLRPRTAAISVALGTTATVIAALFPAFRASRVSPMEALRDSAYEPWRGSLLRVVFGLALEAVGGGLLYYGLLGPQLIVAGIGIQAMFIGVFVLSPSFARPVARLLGLPFALLFGATGRLARDNAIRNPARTARTAAALTIGVALVSNVAILASSLRATIEETIDEQFIGDIVLDSGAATVGGGFSPDVVETVGRLPQVGAISPIRVALGTVAGQPDFFLGVQPAAAAQILDFGIVAGDLASSSPNGILFLESRANQLGLQVGDEVAVAFLGSTPRTLTVSGLFTNEEFAGRQIVHVDLLRELVEQDLDFSAYLTVADGAQLSEARRSIESAIAAYPNVTVLDRDEFLEQQTGSFDVVLGLIYSLLGLAILVAAFGIANTLRLSAIERTREIGLLRAVGADRSQIGRAISMEAAITAVFGSVLGVILGVFFGYANVYALREEFRVAFNVPVPLLVVVVLLGAIIGLVVSIVPAVQASRLNILRAIAGD